MNFSRIMSPAKSRVLCVVLMILAIVLCIVAGVTQRVEFQNGAIAAVVASVAILLMFWRCPRCRRLLPLKNMMHISNCPHCGADVKNFSAK